MSTLATVDAAPLDRMVAAISRAGQGEPLRAPAYTHHHHHQRASSAQPQHQQHSSPLLSAFSSSSSGLMIPAGRARARAASAMAHKARADAPPPTTSAQRGGASSTSPPPPRLAAVRPPPAAQLLSAGAADQSLAGVSPIRDVANRTGRGAFFAPSRGLAGTNPHPYSQNGNAASNQGGHGHHLTSDERARRNAAEADEAIRRAEEALRDLKGTIIVSNSNASSSGATAGGAHSSHHHHHHHADGSAYGVGTSSSSANTKANNASSGRGKEQQQQQRAAAVLAAEAHRRIRVVPRPLGSSNTERSLYQSMLRSSSAVAKHSRTPAGLLQVDSTTGVPLSMSHVATRRMRQLMLGSTNGNSNSSNISSSSKQKNNAVCGSTGLGSTAVNGDEDADPTAGVPTYSAVAGPDELAVYPVTSGSTGAGKSSAALARMRVSSANTASSRQNNQNQSAAAEGFHGGGDGAESESAPGKGGATNGLDGSPSRRRRVGPSLATRLLSAVFTPTPTTIDAIVAGAGEEALRLDAEGERRRAGAKEGIAHSLLAGTGGFAAMAMMGGGSASPSRHGGAHNRQQQQQQTASAAALSALFAPSAAAQRQQRLPTHTQGHASSALASNSSATHQGRPLSPAAETESNVRASRAAFAKMRMLVGDRCAKEQADRARARSNVLNNVLAVINDDPAAKAEVAARAAEGLRLRNGAGYTANTFLAYPPELAAIIKAKKEAAEEMAALAAAGIALATNPAATAAADTATAASTIPPPSPAAPNSKAAGDSPNKGRSDQQQQQQNFMARNAHRAKLHAHLVEADRARHLELEQEKYERALASREQQFYEREAALAAEERAVRGAGKSVAHRWAAAVTLFATALRIRKFVDYQKEVAAEAEAAAAAAAEEYSAYHKSRAALRGGGGGGGGGLSDSNNRTSKDSAAAAEEAAKAEAAAAERLDALATALRVIPRFSVDAIARFREHRKAEAATRVRSLLLAVRDASTMQLRVRLLTRHIRTMQRAVRRYLATRAAERALWHTTVQHCIEERLAFTRQITMDYEKEARRRRAAIPSVSAAAAAGDVSNSISNGGKGTSAAGGGGTPSSSALASGGGGGGAAAVDAALAIEAAAMLIQMHGGGYGPGLGGSLAIAAKAGGSTLQAALLSLRQQLQQQQQNNQSGGGGGGNGPRGGAKSPTAAAANGGNNYSYGSVGESRRAGGSHTTAVPAVLVAEATRVLQGKLGAVMGAARGGVNSPPPQQGLGGSMLMNVGFNNSKGMMNSTSSSLAGHRAGPNDGGASAKAEDIQQQQRSASTALPPTTVLRLPALDPIAGGLVPTSTAVAGAASGTVVAPTAGGAASPMVAVTVHHAQHLNRRYPSIIAQRRVEVARAVSDHYGTSKWAAEALFAASCLPAAAARFWRAPHHAVYFARETHELPHADRTAIRLPSKYRERLVTFFRDRALGLYHQRVAKWRAVSKAARAKHEWELELAVHAARRAGSADPEAEAAARVTFILPPFPKRKRLPTATEARFIVLVGFAIQFLEKRALVEANATISQRANVKTPEGRAIFDREKAQIAAKALSAENIDDVSDRLLTKYATLVAAAAATCPAAAGNSPAAVAGAAPAAALPAGGSGISAANAAAAASAASMVLSVFGGAGGLSESFVTGVLDEAE